MRMNHVIEALCVQIVLSVCAGHAWAGCTNPPLSQQALDQFKSNPKGLVSPDADTRTVEALVRDIAGTDASLAANLVQVAEVAQPRFRTAIAAGLAQAAISCANLDQHAALQIQQAVAGFEDGQFQASFAAVAGDLSTAATDAAFASANGSVGSVVITNPNASPQTSTTPGGGGLPAFVQLTFAGITISQGSAPKTSTASSAANPVSSTR
jgi:hypothetical protein